MGSGFSIDNGCIITNAHVIQDREHVAGATVNSYDGAAYAASLLAMNEEMDIAVLGVKESSSSLAVASDEGMQIGDDVYAIGAPNSLDYTLTKGIISSGHRMIGGYSFIQANIALNSGNSGGPLLNAKGEVIGVNSMKLSDTEGIGFAIPMETVLDYLEETGLHGSSVRVQPMKRMLRDRSYPKPGVKFLMRTVNRFLKMSQPMNLVPVSELL